MYDHVIARPKGNSKMAEPLQLHSDEVAELVSNLTHNDIAQFVSVAARLHDLGKTSTYFQHHVRGKHVEPVKHTYHARIGAFATFHVLDKLCVDDQDKLAGLLAVLRHHGRLPDTARALTEMITSERSESEGGYVYRQINDIDTYEQGRSVADDLLLTASKGRVDWDSFSEAILDGTLYDAISALVAEAPVPNLPPKPNPNALPDTLYDRTLRVWSTLTLADKTCSAGLKDDDRLTPEPLSLAALEKEINVKRKGLDEPPEFSDTTSDLEVEVTDEADLNQIREGIRRLVRENARTFASSDRSVATLTLPTGLGKTYTGITAAYTIRDLIDHREFGESHDPRVIYALPYTSIIEQTRGVFETELNADPLSRAFSVHHYLSDTVTYPDVEGVDGDKAIDDAEYFDAARFGESWRAGTMLTTFVQLFESLTGPTNSRGLKLPALEDSIVVLDEPQTLPKPWWPAIRRLVQMLVNEYNAHVISMTATQPSLFTNTNFETQSLLSSTQGVAPPLERACFEALERTTYHIHHSLDGQEIDHTDAGEQLVDHITGEDTENTSSLAICNTIGSASKLAESVTVAARKRSYEGRHLGVVYRNVLPETAASRQDTESIEPEMLDERPDHESLVIRVLSALGFEPTDCDGDQIEEWTWESVKETNEILVSEFSSRYRPRDRAVLVAVANIIAQSDRPFVFVSTQAVEAGVDISFGSVFRDIAPLDSIVQAAGRCNRSFEWGRFGGDVTVWELAPTEEANKPPAKYIYRQRELTRVKSILLDVCREAHETTLPDTAIETKAVPSYFDWIATEGEADVEDRELTRAFDQCQGTVMASRSLITDYETRDVVVAHTPLERAALDFLNSLLRSNDPDERSDGFNLLNHLSDLRISVPVDKLAELSSVTRLDGRELGDPEGVNVLQTAETGSGKLYDLADGGLRIPDVISDRFSI